MKKKTVYIPIEIKPRELDSQILLSGYLAKSGYRTYIGSKQAINTILKTKKKKGGIYLYKGGHSIEKTKWISKVCDSHVIIDQEIGPVIDDYESIIETRLDQEASKCIDRYYTIGNMAQNAAIKMLPSLKSKIIKTGWPRIDLWKSSFKSLYTEKANYLRKKHGKFLLFSSDFGFTSEKRIEGVYQQTLNSNINNSKDLANTRKKKAENSFKEFKEMVKFLEECDSKLNNLKIIVRPHPAEDINAWQKNLKSLKNIDCVYEGSVTEWIYASSGVLHRGCTTGVQSFISEKPTGYIITNNSNIRENLSYMLSEKINDIDEMLELTKHEPVFNLYDQPKALSERIFITDKSACELLVNDFDSLEVSNEAPWSKNVLTMYIRNFKKKLFSKLKSNKTEKKYSISSFDQKVPGGIQIEDGLSILNKVFESDNIQIKSVIENCLCIEANGGGY